MEVDLQSLFGLHVTWCAHLYSSAETPQLPPSPRIWTRITRALLVRKDRRHLFVTPCFILCRDEEGDDRPAWRSSLAPGWIDGWSVYRSRIAPTRGESWASPPAAPAGPHPPSPPSSGWGRRLFKKRMVSRAFTSFVSNSQTNTASLYQNLFLQRINFPS